MMHRPVYVVMGVTGSGRRQVVADLIDGGFSQDTAIALYFAEDEPPCPEANAALQGRPAVQSFSWHFQNGGIVSAPVPSAAAAIFFILSGKESPVDALEVLPAWLSANDLMLARILTVVDCEKTHAHEALKEWYDACLHFSDVALFTHRGGNCPPGWVEAYIETYRKACYPCLFIQLRKKQVENPALVLDPTVRRLSQAFDSPEDFDSDLDDDFEGDFEDDGLGSGLSGDDSTIDPYFVRLPNGDRAKPVKSVNLPLGQP